MRLTIQATLVASALTAGILPASAQNAASNNLECFPFTANSAQGTRLPCPFFFINFGTTQTFSYQVTTTVAAPKHYGGYHHYYRGEGARNGGYGGKGKTQTVTQTQSGSKRGGPSALMSYAMSSTYCSAGSLIFAAAVANATQNRELLSSEAFEIVGNCWVPVVGGLFWRSMFAANPQWNQNIQTWYGKKS